MKLSRKYIKHIVSILKKSDRSEPLMYYLNQPKVKSPYEIAYRDFKERITMDNEFFEKFVHRMFKFSVRVHNLKGEYYCKTKVSTVAYFYMQDPFVSIEKPAKLVKDYDHLFIEEAAPFNRLENDKLRFNNLYLKLVERRVKRLFSCKRAQIFYHRIIKNRERSFDYRIVLPKDIIDKVIPFMDKYSFNSVKETNIYLNFREAVFIMDKQKTNKPPVEVLQKLENIEENIRLLQGRQKKIQSTAKY